MMIMVMMMLMVMDAMMMMLTAVRLTRYLLGEDFMGCRIGPEPTTDKFHVIMAAEEVVNIIIIIIMIILMIIIMIITIFIINVIFLMTRMRMSGQAAWFQGMPWWSTQSSPTGQKYKILKTSLQAKDKE